MTKTIAKRCKKNRIDDENESECGSEIINNSQILENQNQEKMTIEEIHELQDKELSKKISIGEYVFEKTHFYLIFCFDYTYYVIKFTIRVSGVYLLWIFLHYVASHLYIKLCVPNTLIGFLISPFMTATPHCQGLRWIVYNAANIINNMWVILGTWICSYLLLLNDTELRDNNKL